MVSLPSLGDWLARGARRLPGWRACLLVFVLAFAVRFGLVCLRKDYLGPQGGESVRVARALAQTGVFGDPWMLPTGPTGHLAPAHPFLISLVYRVWGIGDTGELVKYLLGCSMSSLSYALLPMVELAFGLPPQVGLAAGLAGALLPVKYRTEVSAGPAAVLTALALIWVVTQTLFLWRHPEWRLRLAALRGALWGLALLTSPVLGLVLAGVLLLEWRGCGREQPGRYVRFLAVQLAACALVLFPWTIRNYLHFGALCPVRCSFGLELAVSNHDRAVYYTQSPFEPDPYGVHPGSSRREVERIRQLGEYPYFQEKLRSALAWISAHPARFLQLTALRLLYFWFHWTGFWPKDLLHWLMTLLAAAGLAQLRRSNRAGFLMMLNIWLTFPLTYYVVQATTKYRYPMDWTFLLLAALAILGWKSRQKPASGREGF